MSPPVGRIPMAASRPCEECGKVKRCVLYRRFFDPQRTMLAHVSPLWIYVCRRCARALGYAPKGAAHA